MKLIDRIMRDICDVMKWQGWPDAPTEAGTWAGDIRIMLRPRCDAVDAVVTAAKVLDSRISDMEGPGLTKLRKALAALADLSRVRGAR